MHRPERFSAPEFGNLLHLQPAPLDSRKPDQVEAGQWTTDLLHPAAGDELAEVDGEEACVLEKLDHLGLGICVVAGEEDHTLAARLVRVGGENRSAECVRDLHDACAGQQLGDYLGSSHA
jgi:hypothetical protein